MNNELREKGWTEEDGFLLNRRIGLGILRDCGKCSKVHLFTWGVNGEVIPLADQESLDEALKRVEEMKGMADQLVRRYEKGAAAYLN